MAGQSQRGFTLIEAMCTLGVLSVLAGIAAPSVSQWRQRVTANTLLASLSADIALARMTAVSRGNSVVVCPSKDTMQCDDWTDWHDGWIVFLDRNRDRARQSDEDILSTAQPSRSPALSFISTGGRRSIRLLPSGIAYGSNVTVTACLQGMTHARLVMNNAGRVRVERPRPGSTPQACRTP